MKQKVRTKSTYKPDLNGLLNYARKIASHGIVEQGFDEALRLVQNSVWVVKGNVKRRPDATEAAKLIKRK